MNQPRTTRLSSWRRLVFGLALLLGLCAVTGGLARPAHAQSTLKVTNCSSDAQLQADIAQANSDNADDVITFACSGDIKLTSTLTTSGNMTLSGSGQSVTLDGGDSLQVLSVNYGVSLTLKALTIAHGSAGNGGAGGGLYNDGGTVSISNSTFAYNSAPGGGSGGGLFNDINGGTVSISNSTFAYNSAGSGGGLFNDYGGTVSISNSTFAYNSAPGGGSGGGLFNNFAMVISNSTIANNSASNSGGGVYNNGGLDFRNSTIAYNSASNGGGYYNQNQGSIIGSIVAANTGGDCMISSGGIYDWGYNLSSDSSCGFSGTGSRQNTDPKLGPLASNGGPTQTLALLKGSPASDYIPLASAQCPKTDQRGHKRPDNSQESTCDIGAYES